MAIYMQQLLKKAGQNIPTSKPNLEINLDHPVIERLKNENDENEFNEWVYLLFDQAILAEGGQLEDSAGFVRRMNNILLTFAQ